MARAYYNEIDPYAAQWLRNLIVGGHIAPGDVDERSIVDVRPADLGGYAQCHFFAGIGGWSYAARLAGWPDDRPLWTASCPCQPFSVMGQRAGFTDERHLWPEFYRLARELEPEIVFGEQVDSPPARAWLDVVQADMEDAGYAFAPIVLPAASTGAPHGRHRTWFVADAARPGGRRRSTLAARRDQESGGPSSDLCAEAWPDGFGSCSTLSVSDVLSPSYGVPARVGKLRAYGNAIVPQVAAEVIAAFLEVAPSHPMLAERG
jgi:DNA (cytosine-5)-methyltransferase 1